MLLPTESPMNAIEAPTSSRVTTRTAKPIEVRMGKGKGSVDRWAAKVKPGRVMFEIDGVNDATAREALRLAAMKLPVKTRIVVREDADERSTGNLIQIQGLGHGMEDLVEEIVDVLHRLLGRDVEHALALQQLVDGEQGCRSGCGGNQSRERGVR